MFPLRHATCLLAATLLCTPALQAGWLDTLSEQIKTTNALNGGSEQKTAESETASGLTLPEMNGGLKEALSLGTKAAIAQLGKEDGFFGNNLVKIPVPEKVKMMESALRKVGMGSYADDFILALNRAAEKAVPETATIFANAITQMSIEDAKKILGGPDDAATSYFRGTSGDALHAAVLPIVKQFTEETDVTRYYKKMVSAYDQYAAPMVESSGLGGLVNSFAGGGSESSATQYDARDLDSYITGKSLDGLFTVLAEEEKKIRTQPAARTTDLLKKVFSAF